MNALGAAIQADLVARFPAIQQDQTPKYNKGFAALEAGMPLGLPLRTLVGWKLGPDDVQWTAVAAIALVVGGAFVIIRKRRRMAAQTA